MKMSVWRENEHTFDIEILVFSWNSRYLFKWLASKETKEAKKKKKSLINL